MIFKILRFVIICLIILFVFGMLPQSFWDWLKPYFNKDVFVNTIKLGWIKFNQFLKDTLNIDLSQIPEIVKKIFGIDLIMIWLKIKNFLANLFLKIYEFLAR